jgi:hypothetical protein
MPCGRFAIGLVYCKTVNECLGYAACLDIVIVENALKLVEVALNYGCGTGVFGDIVDAAAHRDAFCFQFLRE